MEEGQMTLEELITDLKAAGANENTVNLAMNCYELGKDDLRKALADEIERMPFGDTASSFASFIRGFE
jgi:hypothetical protein